MTVQTLTIRFPKPGFFVNDARVQVWLDGMLAYDGSFLEGFERAGPIQPGAHRLQTRIEFGPIARNKEYTVTIGDAPTYVATLSYSRFWGNFSGSVKLEAPLR